MEGRVRVTLAMEILQPPRPTGTPPKEGNSFTHADFEQEKILVISVPFIEMYPLRFASVDMEGRIPVICVP
jgi:hypothetical protein